MTLDRQPLNGTADPAVEAELDRLATMPIAQLRLRYSQLFRTEPPKAFGPDLLRRDHETGHLEHKIANASK